MAGESGSLGEREPSGVGLLMRGIEEQLELVLISGNANS